MQTSKKLGLALIGPGILVAATGVGAGDLATATLAGAKLGTAVLWAVLVGAGLKFVLNEGLTRWQLATGTTLLEGAVRHLGRPMQWIFMTYLIIWSYLVAMALMSACGVASHAIYPLVADASVDKVIYGILHSLLAVGLVLLGGYRLFERVMSVCIGCMFVVVCMTAIVLRPNLAEICSGILMPRVPQMNSGGLGWTIALLGGVGGTVTVLCYGYWIREEGREKIEDLRICRLDLAVGYSMTALFGLAMIVIGSQLGNMDSKGATLIVEVAQTLEAKLGNLGWIAKWAFLLGAWGAIFSSLLGVWQSVPYLFTDFWRLLNRQTSRAVQINSRSTTYRIHLVALALVPISGLLLFDFASAMKINGIVGALFIPMLAVVLLILNGREALVGANNRNSAWTTVLLSITLIVFLIAGGWQIANSLSAWWAAPPSVGMSDRSYMGAHPQKLAEWQLTSQASSMNLAHHV